MVPPRFFFLSSYFYLPRSCMVFLFFYGIVAHGLTRTSRNTRLRSPLTNYNSRGSRGTERGKRQRGIDVGERKEKIPSSLSEIVETKKGRK